MFKLCNKLEDSETILTIPSVIAVIKIVNIQSKTITALVFLVKSVFLFTIFIIGSINVDIINPIKNGI